MLNFLEKRKKQTKTKQNKTKKQKQKKQKQQQHIIVSVYIIGGNAIRQLL